VRAWGEPGGFLDGSGKSLPIGIPSPDPTARRVLLYRVSYPGTAKFPAIALNRGCVKFVATKSCGLL